MEENKLEQANNQGERKNPFEEKQAALADLYIMLQKAMGLAANDSEYHDFQIIIDALKDDKITPQEAIEKGQAILDGKQDYH